MLRMQVVDGISMCSCVGGQHAPSCRWQGHAPKGSSMKRALACVGTAAMCFAITMHVAADVTPLDPDSVVGFWTFDDGEGTVAKDSSAYGNDGTLAGDEGGLPAWGAGMYGGALEFDGVDDYVLVPSDAGDELNPASEITVAAWMKRDTTISTGHFIVARMDTGTTRTYYFAFWNDKIQLEVSEDGTGGGRLVQEVPEQFTDTADWHHLAGTFAGGVGKIYIDGSIVESAAVISPAAGFHQNDSDVTIGFDMADGAFSFDGMLDEVTILDVAASAANVAELMDGKLRDLLVAVEPAGKLASTWGAIKQR